MARPFNISRGRLSEILIILTMILFIIVLCLGALWCGNIFVCFGGVETKGIMRAAGYIIIAALTAAAFLQLKGKLIFQMLLVVLAAVVLLFYTGLVLLTSGDARYFDFHSPDGSKTVVVEECAWLFAGDSYVYQKTSPFTMVKLEDSIDTDDGYRPFSDGKYMVDWSGSTVHFHYNYGTGDGTYADRTFSLL